MTVKKLSRQHKIVVGILVIVAVGGAVSSLHYSFQAGRLRSERRAEVAAKGAQVMPFDLEQTTHSFEPKADGGLQTVVADDPNNQAQIDLIQAHLEEEANKFQAGDFSSPATIHGEEMPGLVELSDGYLSVQVDYNPSSAGAQIRYTTQSEALEPIRKVGLVSVEANHDVELAWSMREISTVMLWITVTPSVS